MLSRRLPEGLSYETVGQHRYRALSQSQVDKDRKQFREIAEDISPQAIQIIYDALYENYALGRAVGINCLKLVLAHCGIDLPGFDDDKIIKFVFRAHNIEQDRGEDRQIRIIARECVHHFQLLRRNKDQ